MSAIWRFVVIAVFLVGFLLIGLVGTSTSMTFLWPAYGCLGLAGLLSIGLLFTKVSFPLPRWGTLSVFALAGYLLTRASESPVAYFAREDAALIISAFLCYCLFLSLFSTAGWRRTLVWMLIALVSVNLVFALVQAVFNPSLWLVPGYERTFSNRVGGLFNHPDHFAEFLAALVPLWLGIAIFARQKGILAKVCAILAFLSMIVTLFSGSSVGIFTLLSGLVVFVFLAGLVLYSKVNPEVKRYGKKWFAGSALAIFAVTLALSGPIGRELDRSLLNKDGVSLPVVWKTGAQQIAEAPLLGTGSRTSYIYGRLFRPELLTSSSEPEFIHNEYLQIAADYGLAGLVLLILALGMHLVAGLKFVKSYAHFGTAPGRLLPESDHLALVVGALGVLASLGMLSFFDFAMHLPVFVIVASILLAVLAAPDPMASALRPPPSSEMIPGGGLLFLNRAVVLGCGIAMLTFGLVFSRSEYHYEMARLSFEGDRSGFKHHRHLRMARAIDAKNPFVFALSADAEVAGITPELAEPARKQALEQADGYFSHARTLYPQDIFSAVGHAAVLDELGKKDRAKGRLEDALEMAPRYGNLLLAVAEHYFRYGEISKAEAAFEEAAEAWAYRDSSAARQGIRTITEWKLIAEQNGIDWRKDAEEKSRIASSPDFRSLPEARISPRDLAGRAIPAADGKGDTDGDGDESAEILPQEPGPDEE